MKKAQTRQTNTSNRPDPVTAYAKDVLSGAIVAGPHVRNACRRHLSDLEHGAERGLRWDLDAVDRVVGFFRDVLRLNGGQFEGKPFLLQPMQAFIIGSIFGWKRADGTRRFRRAYIEAGKGCGKSPLAGGIGLYAMMADGEERAEIYAAGKDKAQAMVLFRDAVAMVDQSPALKSRITKSGGNPVWNLTDLKTASFFRPISREGASSGPRPYIALCDEIHEHPDGTVIEMLERGFKFRLSPLLLMITNSGSDRNTICWAEHQHAVNVAAGTRTPDDSFSYVGEIWDGSDDAFSYVCALDGARTAFHPLDAAPHILGEQCSCNTAQITPTELPSPRDFAALVMRESAGLKISQTDSGVPITRNVRLLLDAFATLATRDSEKSAIRRTLRSVRSSSESGLNPLARKPNPESATSVFSTRSSQKIKTGTQTELASQSTASAQNRSSNSAYSKMGGAQSVATKSSVSEWITATIRELFEDSSATTAIQESVCSEIALRLLAGHSSTCSVHRRFRLESGRLAESIPADDPITDPTCWLKANPLLGVTLKYEYLEGVVAQAKDIPAKRNGILRLHFCVWTESDVSWLPREAIEKVMFDFDPYVEHAGQRIDAAGLDLSGTKDLTAAAFAIRTGSKVVRRKTPNGEDIDKDLPTYDIWVEAWTPGDTMDERAKVDHVPYRLWAETNHKDADGNPIEGQPYLHAPDGQRVRFDHVAAHFARVDAEHGIGVLGYDNYAYDKFQSELDDYGVTIAVESHPQGGKRRAKPSEARVEAAKAAGQEPPQGLWMPGSVTELETLILEERCRIRRSPVTLTALMGVAMETDPLLGNQWFSKKKSTIRIDPAVAAAMAVGTAEQGAPPPPPQSPWEDEAFSINKVA